MKNIEEQSSGLQDYIALIRRRWLIIATVVPAALFIALLFAFGLSPQYRSTATIILEASPIQRDLIQTTVTSYADQQIEIIQGRVMTAETLEALVREFDPYPDKTDWDVRRKARAILKDTEIERVDAVTLKPLEKSNAFSLHYHNSDPGRAAETTRRLADLFLRYHQQVRAESASDASSFLATQAETVTAELNKLEVLYSQLKARTGDALPDAMERNQAARDRAERDLDSAERELRSAQERESLLAIQLQGISPTLMTTRGDMTDLPTVRAQLAEAEQRYTPDHPDVKRLRRALETLMAQGEAGRSTGARADNPDYLRVQSQLEAARREVAALRAATGRARAQISEYASLLRAAPSVEREYNEIARRRSVLQEQFQDIQSKLRDAQLGQVFEAERRGERFTLVREPFAASSPHFPNRLGLALLGLVLGLVIAAVAVSVKEGMDPSVRSLGDAMTTAGLPVIGVVPLIKTDEDIRKRRQQATYLALAYAVALLVLGLVAMRPLSGSATSPVQSSLATPIPTSVSG